MIENLIIGFDVVLTLKHLMYCLLGVSVGTAVGVLPGLGPLAAISLLIPMVYHVGDPVGSMIFLSAIYYGTQYGGSTTAILLKLPGEAGSTVTVLDGHAMTRNGRAGAALTIAALASFFAGTVSTMLLAALAEPLSSVALSFGSAEYAALMLLGLMALVSMTRGPLSVNLSMVFLGCLLGTVGLDVNAGESRFTFGNFNLIDGLNFGVVCMAMFGLAEIVYDTLHRAGGRISIPPHDDLYPSKSELKRSLPAMVRGTVIGFVVGLISGGGAVLASITGYFVEKSVSKSPERFGKGAEEGVANAEAANNAGVQAGFIPMLSLGIPTNPVMALLLAALIINDIQPGPQVVSSNPQLFWGLIVSMWIGNLFLLILNIPLIGIWIKLLQIPRLVLYPLIVTVCMIGAYSINNNWFDVWMLIPFTLLGYTLKRLDCEPAPVVLGFVIGPMFEEYLRRSLTLGHGSLSFVLDRPVAVSLLLLALVFLVGKLAFTKAYDTR